LVRKKYSKELKARIALEAVKGQKTIAELASEIGAHTKQISTWKKQLLDAVLGFFSNRYVKSFNCFIQFLCMTFDQLTHREKLHYIETCL